MDAGATNVTPSLCIAVRLPYEISFESPMINSRRAVAISCNAFIPGTPWATSPAPSNARWNTGTAPSADTAIPAWTCFKSGRRSFG